MSRALDFKPFRKNTLRGFFTLEFAGKVQIRDCTLHEQNGKAWFGFPGIPYTDPKGATSYKNVVIVPDREVLEKVRAEVVAQLAEHLDQMAIV